MVRASGDVLVRVEAGRGTGFAAAASAMTLGAAGTTFALEPLFEVPAGTTRGPGLAPAPRAGGHRARGAGGAGGGGAARGWGGGGGGRVGGGRGRRRGPAGFRDDGRQGHARRARP